MKQILLTFGSLLGVAVCALSQGSLTPPGAPGPTMKTLTQVEPRTPIDSVPFTITRSGSYYLTDNLVGNPGQDGIVIAARDVSLDLKGFTISRCLSAIRADMAANPADVVIANGIMSGCGLGVDLGAVSKCHLEHLLVCNNGGKGINVGSGSWVTFCGANLNQSAGICVGDGSAVLNCVVQSNLADGIVLSGQCRATDNLCDGNGTSSSDGGIHASGQANRIEGNSLNRNSHGIKVDGTANLVVRNNACGSSGADYDIAVGNNYGQILAGPGSGFVNSNPWANFSCSGSGQVCTSDSDCQGLSNECNDGACFGGLCGTRPKPENYPCTGGICLGGVCQPMASCSDSIKNGTETDVDCGGTSCPQCAVGRQCLANADCTSGLCQFGFCQSAASCSDGVKDGTETDVDCGGGCSSKCGDNRSCLVNNDCQSGICQGGICRGASCTDGVKNGTETDVDCGGTCPSKCSNGRGCGSGADCQSGYCSAGICQTLICPAGFGDCDLNPVNGCETDLMSSPNNCGGCGRVCSGNHISNVTCGNGVCNGACDLGYLDCDGNKQANGCETNILADSHNCGGCGIQCPGAQTCHTGVCQ